MRNDAAKGNAADRLTISKGVKAMENNETTPETKVAEVQDANPEKSAAQVDNKRLRDDKGHFLPNPDKTCTHKPARKPKKQKDDENTVKIRIIKEEQPLPEKEYEGKLEDLKERTASNFIKAVSIRKPRCISIDGNMYYAKSEVDSLRESLSDEKGSNESALGTLKKMHDCIKTATETIEALDADRTRVYRSRNLWRGIAFGTLAAFLSFVIGSGIEMWKAKKIAANPTAQPVQVEESK